MLGKGNNPEDATKLFNKALERLQSQQFDDADRYFDLSLYYELRPVTFFERAKLRLLRLCPTQTVLKDVEDGLKLCAASNEHSNVYCDLLSLKTNVIEPLIAAEKRTLAEKEQRKAIIRGLAVAGKYEEVLETTGLTQCIDDLKQLSLPAIRMKVQEPHNGGISSRFGGSPDVPPNFKWPLVDCEEVVPLEFLCQLDLVEITKIWPDSGLPSSGLLSFFADASEFSFGGDPSAWQVFYFENKGILERAQPPSPSPIRAEFAAVTFPACSVEFEYLITLPEVYSEAMRKIITGDEERERYEELISGWQGDAHDTPTHQMFGHPQAIQEDVFIECNDQIDVFNPKFQERFRKPSEDLLDPVNEWLLLLQIASDDEANFLWGDSGKLYFCIRRGDLAARNFAAVVLVGQCF